MKGMELRLVPTAIHVVGLGHDTLESKEPEGGDEVGFQAVKSFVLMDVAPPVLATPTATQVEALPQETADMKFIVG